MISGILFFALCLYVIYKLVVPQEDLKHFVHKRGVVKRDLNWKGRASRRCRRKIQRGGKGRRDNKGKRIKPLRLGSSRHG